MKKFLLIIFLYLFGQSCTIAANTDSLLKVLKSNLHDTLKIQASLKLVFHYKPISVDSSLYYCGIAYKLLNNHTPPKWKAKVNLANAQIYQMEKGEFKIAEKYVLQALKFALQTNNKKLTGDIYLSASGIYGSMGDYEVAMDNLLNAERCYLPLNFKSGLSSVYTNLGLVFYNQNNYAKALNYYKKALKIRTENNDRVLGLYQNIAGVHYRLHNYDSALYCIDIALKQSITEQDKSSQTMAVMSKAAILREMGKLEESIECERQVRKFVLESGDKWALAHSFSGSAHCFFMKKNYNASVNDYLQSIKLNKEINAKEELTHNYFDVSRAYDKLGKYQLAYDALSKFSELKDSISGIEISKNIELTEAKYESEKKEKEIIILNKAKIQDSLKIALHEIQVRDKDLKIEKRQVQLKYLFVIAILLAGFGLWIFNALRNKQKVNLIIQQQKDDVEFQKSKVDEKQKEIIDSINYAKRIQNALLSNKEEFEKSLSDHFLLLKPKDIVSGDFYWATKVVSDENELFYLAVCDSTGHGVPGGFMSLLNMGFLSEAILEKNILSPAKVFDFVRMKLEHSISQEGQQDGMDAILLCIDSKNKTISYSAANNAPLIVSNGKALYLSFDKMPVGKGEKTENFSAFEHKYEVGDSVYLYTDGFADQFGGPKGKKFKYRPLEELLCSNVGLSMEKQRNILENVFMTWKGELEQVDDVCMVGIKL